MTHPFAHTARLRARYAETDQMGVVYHTHYLIWCEIARTGLIRELGMPYAELERNGTFLVVADASIRYHAPARYDDAIAVDAWIERVQTRAVTFGYEIRREVDTPRRLASASTRLIALDRDGSARTIPAPLVKVLRARTVAETV